MSTRSITSITVAALAFTAVPALGQWSDDPAENLAVGALTGSDVQPKVVATAAGGCYISWYSGSGFDVRLQRLDAQGNATWAPGGILVADRSFSSTQDYGLAVDATDAALLAFRDDRFGGVRITAVRVAADGSFPWGASGAQFANGTDFVAAPKIAAADGGDAVVAWTNEAAVHLQRIDASGDVVWGDVTVIADASAQLSVSDLHPSIAGAVIASWVRQTSFQSPKHLYAQRIDASGAESWPARVAVFDGDSLQFGNFPSFVPDGAGGAVFGWYGVGPLQCYAQRVTVDGMEVFPHNGVAGSTNAAQLRTGPSVDFDPSTGETYLFWREQNTAQSLTGVYGQKYDANGSRQWGDVGVEVLPVDGQRSQVRTLAVGAGGGAMVFFADEVVAFAEDDILGARLDAAGNAQWIPLVNVSTAPSEATRLAAARATCGEAILAWQDSRGDTDVYAQNVNPDGSLGVTAPGDVNGDGVVDVEDLLDVLADWGPCPGCPTDLNCDGVVDVNDLLEVLANWT